MGVEIGIVTEVNNEKNIRVIIPRRGNSVSYELELATHLYLGDIRVDDEVTVAFYNEVEGIIVAKCRY